MNHLDLPRSLAVEKDLGYDNLVIGGCSFSHNSSGEHITTWPYYLRDFGNFKQIYDCSMPGAGNRHICQSVMCAIESQREIQPENSMVVIMWSGYDRDDFMIDPAAMKQGSDRYYYTNNVACGATGGLLGESNVVIDISAMKKIKSMHSRALENYLIIVGMHHYLSDKKIAHVFTEFSTPGTKRDSNFEITDYLPKSFCDRFRQLVRQLSPNLNDFDIINQISTATDGYHLDANAHMHWTRHILLPYLCQNIDCYWQTLTP